MRSTSKRVALGFFLCTYNCFSAFTSEPWILSQFLNLAGNETIVRQQDFFTAVRYVATNPIGECGQMAINYAEH